MERDMTIYRTNEEVAEIRAAMCGGVEQGIASFIWDRSARDGRGDFVPIENARALIERVKGGAA